MKTNNSIGWFAGLLFAVTPSLALATSPPTYFIYDESGHVIGEYAADGTPIQEHVYLGDRPIAVVSGGSSGTVDYVSTDHLGTPRVITDSSEAVVWSWNSDPFGNGSPSGPLTYNLRFPGQYYDAETGHNYNYYRDYDATTGRYTESDPIGLLGGVNTYAYVSGNPLRARDFYGLNKADCQKLLQDLIKQANDLQGYIDRYDPFWDAFPWWSNAKQGWTSPGNHYQQIKDRQGGLLKRIKNYDRNCRKKKNCDDDDDNNGPPVPQNVIDVANEIIPEPQVPFARNPFEGLPNPFGPATPGLPVGPPVVIPVP
jgi:RHS repeat-associated protein